MGKEIFFSGIIRELNILWTVSQSLFHLYFREVMGRSSSLSFFCLWCLLGGGWYFLEGQCKDHSWQEQPRWSDFPLEALKLWDSAMLKDHCSEFLSPELSRCSFDQQVLYSYTLFENIGLLLRSALPLSVGMMCCMHFCSMDILNF